jgi:hypothetical protein
MAVASNRAPTQRMPQAASGMMLRSFWRTVQRRLLRRSWRHAPQSLARLMLRPFPDQLYLALGHLCYFGRWPDYRRPRSFNEHIQAYMLRCRDPLLRVAADKIASRDYIASRVGTDLLVPLIGVWDRAEDVPLDQLARPCVLKPTAASGMVLMLRPRDQIDLTEVRAVLNRWLQRDYSKLHREWCYEGLPRRLLAEQMLVDDRGTIPPDYKAYVIGGKVRFIQVDRGRFAHHTRNIYGPTWDALPARWTLENHAPDVRPACLPRMLQVAEALAEPFEFLRVDFYVLRDRLYVGELTNYPGAGFEKFIPGEYALHIGSFWDVGQTAASRRPDAAKAPGMQDRPHAG